MRPLINNHHIDHFSTLCPYIVSNLLFAIGLWRASPDDFIHVLQSQRNKVIYIMFWRPHMFRRFWTKEITDSHNLLIICVFHICCMHVVIHQYPRIRDRPAKSVSELHFQFSCLHSFCLLNIWKHHHACTHLEIPKF